MRFCTAMLSLMTALMWTYNSFAQDAGTALSMIPGKWKGPASIAFDNGKTEKANCVATNSVDGPNVKQVLRCATSTLKFTVHTDLQTDGQGIKGDWNEETFQMNGGAEGQLTPNGYTIKITSDGMNGNLTLTTDKCNQVLALDIESIAKVKITLTKCASPSSITSELPAAPAAAQSAPLPQPSQTQPNQTQQTTP